jgi:hypothetical protein
MEEAVRGETTDVVPFGIQDLKPANIAVLKQRCEEMEIGPNGEGYEDVKVVHIRVKRIRTEIKDRHKEKKAAALKVCQEWDDKKRKMNALIEPIIDTLAAKRKVWDDKVAAIEEEKKRKEQERIDARFDQLNKYDCKLPWQEVAVMTDEEFQTALERAQTHYKEEQERKEAEEAERKRKDEAERKEREAEATKLKAEREELEKARKKQAEKDAELKAEQKRLEDEKKALEDEKRKAAEEEARKKAEAEKEARREALKPDKEKLITWVYSFSDQNIPEPILENKEAQHILKAALSAIEIVLQDALEKAEAL